MEHAVGQQQSDADSNLEKLRRSHLNTTCIGASSRQPSFNSDHHLDCISQAPEISNNMYCNNSQPHATGLWSNCAAPAAYGIGVDAKRQNTVETDSWPVDCNQDTLSVDYPIAPSPTSNSSEIRNGVHVNLTKFPMYSSNSSSPLYSQSFERLDYNSSPVLGTFATAHETGCRNSFNQECLKTAQSCVNPPSTIPQEELHWSAVSDDHLWTLVDTCSVVNRQSHTANTAHVNEDSDNTGPGRNSADVCSSYQYRFPRDTYGAAELNMLANPMYSVSNTSQHKPEQGHANESKMSRCWQQADDGMFRDNSATALSMTLPSMDNEKSSSPKKKPAESFSKYGLDLFEQSSQSVVDYKGTNDETEGTVVQQNSDIGTVTGESFVSSKTAAEGADNPIMNAKEATTCTKAEEKLFFDPRRIFDTRSKAGPANSKSKQEAATECTKAACSPDHSANPACSDDKTAHVISDSSSGRKLETNSAADEKLPRTNVRSSPVDCDSTFSLPHGSSKSSRAKETKQDESDCKPDVRQHLDDDVKTSRESVPSCNGQPGHAKHHSRHKTPVFRHGAKSNVRHPAARKMKPSVTKAKTMEDLSENRYFSWLKNFDMDYVRNAAVVTAKEFVNILTNVAKILAGVLLFELYTCLESAWSCVRNVAHRCSAFVQSKLAWWRKPKAEEKAKPSSLEENITLPTTGEEAMRRLFACKGKNPYSILGLRVDCTDDDIKRYYRRQAVLVHPDKNHEPGAEEAFKILNHAFEMIGEPDNRKQYDAVMAQENENNKAMQEFTDLLTKLHEVMKETVNLMACNYCGGKHRRYPVDVCASAARYCERCNERHAAKEGDVWAESTMMGFRWHYFACMDGDIYNITEWAKCQSEDFRHLKANSHFVMMHIATGAKNSGSNRSVPSDPNIEQFLNSVFGAAAAGAGTPAGSRANPFAGSFFGSAGSGKKTNQGSSSNTAGATPSATSSQGGSSGSGSRKRNKKRR